VSGHVGDASPLCAVQDALNLHVQPWAADVLPADVAASRASADAALADLG
jgi:hypothetical protein